MTSKCMYYFYKYVGTTAMCLQKLLKMPLNSGELFCLLCTLSYNRHLAPNHCFMVLSQNCDVKRRSSCKIQNYTSLQCFFSLRLLPKNVFLSLASLFLRQSPSTFTHLLDSERCLPVLMTLLSDGEKRVPQHPQSLPVRASPVSHLHALGRGYFSRREGKD